MYILLLLLLLLLKTVKTQFPHEGQLFLFRFNNHIKPNAYESFGEFRHSARHPLDRIIFDELL